MRLYIIETREIREITVRKWTGAGWSPDMAADVADGFSGRGTFPGDTAIVCTADDLTELLDYLTLDYIPANYTDADECSVDNALLETLTEANVREAITNTDFRGLLDFCGLSQAACARRFGIPVRTVENWCAMSVNARRECALYVRLMMAECMGLIGKER